MFGSSSNSNSSFITSALDDGLKAKKEIKLKPRTRSKLRLVSSKVKTEDPEEPEKHHEPTAAVAAAAAAAAKTNKKRKQQPQHDEEALRRPPLPTTKKQKQQRYENEEEDEKGEGGRRTPMKKTDEGRVDNNNNNKFEYIEQPQSSVTHFHASYSTVEEKNDDDRPQRFQQFPSARRILHGRRRSASPPQKRRPPPPPPFFKVISMPMNPFLDTPAEKLSKDKVYKIKVLNPNVRLREFVERYPDDLYCARFCSDSHLRPPPNMDYGEDLEGERHWFEIYQLHPPPPYREYKPKKSYCPQCQCRSCCEGPEKCVMEICVDQDESQFPSIVDWLYVRELPACQDASGRPHQQKISKYLHDHKPKVYKKPNQEREYV